MKEKFIKEIKDQLNEIAFNMMSDKLGYEVNDSNMYSAYRDLVSRGLDIKTTHNTIDYGMFPDNYSATMTTTIEFVPIDKDVLRVLRNVHYGKCNSLSFKDHSVGHRPGQVFEDDVMSMYPKRHTKEEIDKMIELNKKGLHTFEQHHCAICGRHMRHDQFIYVGDGLHVCSFKCQNEYLKNRKEGNE